MRKKQWLGLTAIGFFILVLELCFYCYKKSKILQPEEEAKLIPLVAEPLLLSKFNPNDLTYKEWIKLGFTPKQAQSILNYKEKACKGSFISPKQLEACFAISSEKFAELKPYLILPLHNSFNKPPTTLHKNRSLKVTTPFNPDLYTIRDWMNLGFSERQAKFILKYKKSLGNSFLSKEKFRKCFIINEHEYQQLAPFLLLPERINKPQPLNSSTKLNKLFDPNDLDLASWQRLGFSEKQARGILSYKEKILKGQFKSLEDVQKCYLISSEKFSLLKSWIHFKETTDTDVISTINENLDLNSISFQQLRDFGFDKKTAARLISFRRSLGGFVRKEQVWEIYDIDENLAQKLIQTMELNPKKVQKIDLLTTNEVALKKHPYFRSYAQKILFYRLSFPKRSDLLKKLNAKPEHLEKIQWYLK
ncbi:hypothetical protein GNY06_12385 [Elizabethkingia argentiflava]|uniref:Helix-hairpin-helix domain-containing protein n=2 Tax=Elizabethkingia argenteiflava TaxID=2681556 RepID=A0A845PWX4_9FLAO|nr:hypothetical protein [Elizabethkingia argenteiflava]